MELCAQRKAPPGKCSPPRTTAPGPVCRTRRKYDSRRRQQQAERTRHEIVEAAHGLFVERGYVDTTMSAIADAAEVAVETISRGFGSKAALFQAVVEAAVAGGVERAQRPVAMPDLRHEMQEALGDGDVEMARVVVTGTLTTTFGGIASTGRSFRIDQAVITHLRDGKVAEAWEIADIASLRAPVANP